jgi:hypothetical protein
MEDIKPTASSASHAQNSDASADSSTLHARPTVADLHGDNHFAQVARKNWLTATKAPKVRAEVVKKELWDELEAVDFAYPSLLVLENLQLLERYLWPGFTEDASNYHHLLLALMVNVKRRENLPSWGKELRQLSHHCTRGLANKHRRTVRRKARRILRLLPPDTVHDRGSITAHQNPDTAHILRHWSLPVSGQRPRTEGVRTTGRNIHLAEPALGRSPRPVVRTDTNAAEGMARSDKAI